MGDAVHKCPRLSHMAVIAGFCHKRRPRSPGSGARGRLVTPWPAKGPGQRTRGCRPPLRLSSSRTQPGWGLFLRKGPRIRHPRSLQLESQEAPRASLAGAPGPAVLPGLEVWPVSLEGWGVWCGGEGQHAPPQKSGWTTQPEGACLPLPHPTGPLSSSRLGETPQASPRASVQAVSSCRHALPTSRLPHGRAPGSSWLRVRAS